MRQYFQLLGVNQNATPEQLAQAYQQQLAAWDPRRFSHNERLRRTAERKTQELKIAFRHLERAKQSRPSFLEHSDNSGSTEFSTESISTPNVLRRGQRSIRPRVETRITALKEFLTAAAYTSCLVALAVVCLMVAIDLGSIIEKVDASAAPAQTLATRVTEGAEFSSGSLFSLIPLSFGVTIAESTDRNLGSASEPPSASRALSPELLNEQRPRLIESAVSCDVRTARRLLNGGADVNAHDAAGDSALTWAAKVNCPAIAKLLIERGADPLHVSANGFTPVRWAAWYKSFEVQRVLNTVRY